MRDPVVAIATPLGESAIAAIRVTGDDCLSMMQALIGDFAPVPRKALHVVLRNPEDSSPLDDVIVIYYKSPASYTGEDMIEIFCHGGLVSVQTIYENLLQIGFKSAPPGEFTKRAVYNGKMDIFQAESVEQIVRARSKEEVELSVQTLKGKLTRTFKDILQQVSSIQVKIEARISFPDDIEEDDQEIFSDINHVTKTIENHLYAHTYIQKIQKGFSITLMGRTNVGKSTLFNTLVGYDRTLVSPYPSTTHDYVSEEVLWDGYSIHLYDTAGYIADATQPLDIIFNERMQSLFDSSFLLVYILDTVDFRKDDLLLIDQYKRSNMILVVNKTDISSPDPSWIKQLPHHLPMIEISAKNKTGIDELIQHITHTIKESLGKVPEYYINQRQFYVLQQINSILQSIDSSSNPFLDQIAEDFQEIVYILKEELDVSHNPKLLEEIFSRFCIGK
ncbi:MAG TPA: tRNA uridine-5-carboxymethylaminomethyl(34) synthesis GTPase MnmE [Caldisericia bacterium]|nr:tRNA uridine-5-carboxymethylaminomethyl(34) synthesis GTPase MnmE [Caldisericia bacterium]